MIESFRNGILDRGVITHIRDNGQTLAAVLLNELLFGDEVLLLTASDRELCTVLGERPCDAARDTSRPASYERHLAV
jgi:hypothetical protein